MRSITIRSKEYTRRIQDRTMYNVTLYFYLYSIISGCNLSFILSEIRKLCCFNLTVIIYSFFIKT